MYCCTIIQMPETDISVCSGWKHIHPEFTTSVSGSGMHFLVTLKLGKGPESQTFSPIVKNIVTLRQLSRTMPNFSSLSPLALLIFSVFTFFPTLPFFAPITPQFFSFFCSLSRMSHLLDEIL